MITIANPEKYVAGLYERLSNENIEVGNGEVIVTNEDEQERMGQQLCCLYCDVLYVDVLCSRRYNKLGE